MTALSTKKIILFATSVDADRSERKTVTRTHLEEGGHLLLQHHFAINDKGRERITIELRMRRK